MDNRYEIFCLADRYFYESLDRLPRAARDDSGSPSVRHSAPRVEDFDTARRDVPDGWRALRTGDWLHLDPTSESAREGRLLQGWKVHVSAGLGNADKVAAKVWDHCVPRGIPFKFVPSPQLLHLRNSKYAGRDTSGKFVTI